jgi:hypothetical protein
VEVRGHVSTRAVAVLLRRNLAQVLAIVHEQRRHLRDRKDVIDQAGRCRALRHAAHRCRVEVPLSQRQAAVFLYFSQPDRAVAAGPGQDDADRKLTLILGKRGKESVDRSSMLARRSRLQHLQRSAADCES